MSDPVRAAFEAWFEADALPSEADWFRREDDNPNEYYHGVTHRAWLAWQWSRRLALEEAAAMVAAMIISPTDIILCADTIDEAAARIRALGAK